MSAARLIYIPGPAGDPPPVVEIGGKARALARLSQLAGEGDFGVPPFVVLLSGAFEQQLSALGPWPESTEDASRRQREIHSLPMPDRFDSNLREGLDAVHIGAGLLAVRSSASDEDGSLRSFAGQFDSVLGVPYDGQSTGPVWEAVRRVWASAFSPHVRAYLAGGEATGEVRMAVIIEAMVDPTASGVVFSLDPVTGDKDTTVVSAVYGLGEGLVSGELDADTYHVRFESGGPAAIRHTLANKLEAIRLTPDGGTRREAVDRQLAQSAALSDGEIERVGRCSRFLAGKMGSPQDVEWALVGEPGVRDLVVLQTRPITAGAGGGEITETGEDTVRRIWDNSNIIESYSGVTTPLTFHFASGVYRDVYLQFCRLMGVPEAMLENRLPMFANMLGLIRGRVYYNLLNWYRMLALLPGFQFNRGFMENMMGVRERLEETPETPSAGSRVADLGRLLRTLFRMFLEERRLDKDVAGFRHRVDTALAPVAGENLASWPPNRIVALYKSLERDLLHHWQPPIVNDFFAMIYFGVLGRLTERWLPGAPPTLINDLLCGEGGIISTEPARRVMQLARQVDEAPDLRALFDRLPDERELWERLSGDPEHAAFFGNVEQYIGKFGDRCMEELKLETVTLAEDPVPILAMIRAYLAAGAVDAISSRKKETAIRDGAESQVRKQLRGTKRFIYRKVLSKARRRVRDRENLRFERTRVFGVVRRIFVSLGEHLASRAQIDRPRDVFYLTRDEIFDAFENGKSDRDLRDLVQRRRTEFEVYANEPAPPDRFETVGPPSSYRPPTSEARGPGAAPADVGELSGIGCCPGVVRAAVRIVSRPDEASDLPGRILVAERTDPGWTLLFPMAAGILVERGSLLSHSAIVAREMGIPCVVGVAGLLDILSDGEKVEMNGTTGIVLRLDEKA
jgi:pyruvate,water dikinase